MTDEALAELLKIVKARLRLEKDDTTFDQEELAPLILAALKDMELSGVAKHDAGDALVRQAVSLYCKANFGYDKESDRFRAAYNGLRDSMAMCGEYNGGLQDNTGAVRDNRF